MGTSRGSVVVQAEAPAVCGAGADLCPSRRFRPFGQTGLGNTFPMSAEHVQDSAAAAAKDQLQPGGAAEKVSEPTATPLGALASMAETGTMRGVTGRTVLALQRQAGNRAARSLVSPPAIPVQRQDMTAPAPPFQLGQMTITTYGDAAAATRLYSTLLKQEADELTKEGLAVPASVKTVVDAGKSNIDLWSGGGGEPFDLGNAEDLRGWYDTYVKAMNACRAAQAVEAAARARAAADKAEEASAAMDRLVPALRDMQREAFRKGNDDALLEIADAVAGVIDTALVTKEAITTTLEVASDLRAWANTGRTSPTVITMTEKVPAVLDAIEKINKAYAVFQLARAALDVVGGGGKTEQSSGHTAVSTMATTVSAGGTLLGASVGFTLYSNLYIGPMVSACLSLLSKVENLLSKGKNRQYIEMGDFRSVNWRLEPGGRAVFDFMLAVMKSGSSDEVPAVPQFVKNYMIKQEDSINAGVGGKYNELPTTGWWLWKKVDDKKIKWWVFRNRQNLWGMLYGACAVP